MKCEAGRQEKQLIKMKLPHGLRAHVGAPNSGRGEKRKDEGT